MKKILCHELPLYLLSPSQKLVRKYLLNSYDKYPTTRIIVDGDEISLKEVLQGKHRHKHGLIIKAIALGKHLFWYFS